MILSDKKCAVTRSVARLLCGIWVYLWIWVSC